MDELHLPADLYWELMDQSDLKVRIHSLRGQPVLNEAVVDESRPDQHGRPAGLLQQLVGEWFR
jgi:hypothetical protein